MISDYSFFGVNDDTDPLAPPEAMQFGQTLKRLLQRIHRANEVFGPVCMSKIDVSGDFYCLWLQPENTLKLAVLILSHSGGESLIGIPLTNPMGWRSLPPNFSACTEKMADLANASLESPSEQATARMTPHRLDTISEMAPLDIPPIISAHILSILCTTPFKKPLQYWNIYVNDFCGLVQGNFWTRRWAKQILLHPLDNFFRPFDNEDTAFRQEPSSIKK